MGLAYSGKSGSTLLPASPAFHTDLRYFRHMASLDHRIAANSTGLPLHNARGSRRPLRAIAVHARTRGQKTDGLVG